jgi:hypothetical protein
MLRIWITVLLAFVIVIYVVHHQVQKTFDDRAVWISHLQKRLDDTDARVKNELAIAVTRINESRQLQYETLKGFMLQSSLERKHYSAELKKHLYEVKNEIRESCERRH